MIKKFLSAWASLWAAVLLGLCYYLVLGPACMLARALGWDPLELELRRGSETSYWRPRENDDEEPGCSERTY